MLSAYTLSLDVCIAKYKCSMPTYSLWQRWCRRRKVYANWLIANLNSQVCAYVGKEEIWRKRSKFSPWIVQSCAAQPMCGVCTCFLAPWCKSVGNSAAAKWHYFFLRVVQIRGKVLAFVPGGSDLVFPVSEATSICHVGLPPRAVSCRLLLCFFCSVFCLLWLQYETIRNFLLWGI